MSIADFISNLVTNMDFSELDSYQRYAIIVGSVGVVTMLIEKVFGFFAIAIARSRKGA